MMRELLLHYPPTPTKFIAFGHEYIPFSKGIEL